MNERIKELAVHAGFAADPNGKWPTITSIGPELEEFAELIVRECVVRAEREWIRNGDTEHNQAISKVIKSIKQHFGVEE
jgi:hypothetical protein